MKYKIYHFTNSWDFFIISEDDTKTIFFMDYNINKKVLFFKDLQHIVSIYNEGTKVYSKEIGTVTKIFLTYKPDPIFETDNLDDFKNLKSTHPELFI